MMPYVTVKPVVDPTKDQVLVSAVTLEILAVCVKVG